ncbi:hypothetical protein MXD59_19130 [Frankia sp. Ag45/Mut15]|uniref:Uncharacterized protein n=1 Tax=Frankia umida TaxID=573489 RepID=A0ABT0K254_9ACTN|nr:hypothetical protein [Frankia umida]MCK9877864.1 hypothetical protein [Frankia umida]
MLDRGKRPSAPEVTAHIALGTLAACYARAAERLSDPAVGGIDAQEFPGVAYYAVVSLSDDVLAMLGRILRARLNLPLEVNDVEVAQRWVDDVRATAWSTLVAEQGDHFGRHIAPRVGQRHNA